MIGDCSDNVVGVSGVDGPAAVASCSSGRLGSSAAGQPAPQSRVTSSVGSVGKSKNTVCLLIENDEQMAIACVGMADVNIQITLGISGEV